MLSVTTKDQTWKFKMPKNHLSLSMKFLPKILTQLILNSTILRIRIALIIMRSVLTLLKRVC